MIEYLGVIIVCDQTLSDTVQKLGCQRVDISLIRDKLLSGSVPVSEALALF